MMEDYRKKFKEGLVSFLSLYSILNSTNLFLFAATTGNPPPESEPLSCIAIYSKIAAFGTQPAISGTETISDRNLLIKLRALAGYRPKFVPGRDRYTRRDQGEKILDRMISRLERKGLTPKERELFEFLVDKKIKILWHEFNEQSSARQGTNIGVGSRSREQKELQQSSYQTVLHEAQHIWDFYHSPHDLVYAVTGFRYGSLNKAVIAQELSANLTAYYGDYQKAWEATELKYSQDMLETLALKPDHWENYSYRQKFEYIEKESINDVLHAVHVMEEFKTLKPDLYAKWQANLDKNPNARRFYDSFLKQQPTTPVIGVIRREFRARFLH